MELNWYMYSSLTIVSIMLAKYFVALFTTVQMFIPLFADSYSIFRHRHLFLLKPYILRQMGSEMNPANFRQKIILKLNCIVRFSLILEQEWITHRVLILKLLLLLSADFCFLGTNEWHLRTGNSFQCRVGLKY